MELDELKYPIGKYLNNKSPKKETKEEWIKDIEEFPAKVESLLAGISKDKLNWKYRPDGWTIKQLIHHCADSHLNSISRFKLALTEDLPTIRPYFEDRWAELFDSQEDDIGLSMNFLKALHAKWAKFLRGLNDDQLKREFIHPEYGVNYNLAETIGNYAWHCNHHFAHIKNALESGGKYN